MRTILSLLFSIAASAVGSVAAANPDQPVSAADQLSQMRRGVNIVGYDPLWKDSAKARFQPGHMEIIRNGGFDSVRIVLYAFEHMDENDQLPERWFATLDGLVQTALAQGLTVVLDEHDSNFCGREPVVCRRKLLAFWGQVGRVYAKAPDKVVFEILNEPNKKLNKHRNALSNEALAVIRKTNPHRNVVIGPGFWNNIHWLDKLALPKNDRHLIVTVHYYLPMRFTHQGASWTNYKQLGISWGTPEERAELEQDFNDVQAWSASQDRPILLGEFGAYDKAPLESRVAYTSAVARAAEKRGWAWAYWQFDSDFILYNIDQDTWMEPIYRALIPSIPN
jgi:endoglucanase